MKRTFVIALAILFLLTACQATPDAPIVVQKDMEQMLEKAQGTENIPEKSTQPRTETSEHKASIFITILGIPQNLKLESISAKGKLLVHTDASIILPQADKMPIASVKMSRLANDTVKRLVEVLFVGARPVSDDLSLLPPKYYDNIIEDLTPNANNDTWFSERYLEQAEYDASLADTMQSLENAPSQATYEPLQYQFDIPAEDGKYVHYYALRDDGRLS